MELSLRMKEYRDFFGWTQNDLSEKSGISISTIKKYESGIAENFTYENLKKISSAFNVTPSDFLNEFLSVNVSPNPPRLKPQSDMIRIPLLHHINASAGNGAINELPEDIEHRGFTKEILRENFGITGGYQDLFIMHSFGNSMFPTIPQNALLLVQKGSPLEGQICVARIGAEMFVKRIAKYPKIELLSDNDKYKPIPITDEMDFEVIGRVVGYFGSL